MKPSEKEVAEASRIEFDKNSGKLFIVFEIKDEQYKNYIKNNWTDDIEFKIIDRKLVIDEDEFK